MDAIEFIDKIRPDHGRTSCSDENTINGLYSRTGDTWHGRCTRCMMLEIARGDEELPENFDPDEFNG